MATEGRHPVCTNEEHVKRYIVVERDERANGPTTIKEKLGKRTEAYEYWQEDPSFPHPQDYNPFTLARGKVRFGITELKKPPVSSCTTP